MDENLCCLKNKGKKKIMQTITAQPPGNDLLLR